MPTARDSLLEAARDAVERRPWPVVRMVEVAAAAGVSRQTLYNEFGDKAGLGSALVEHQVTTFLDGFVAGLSELSGPADSQRASSDDALTRATAWMADWLPRAVRRDRLVRATLTGCHTADLPPYAAQPGQLVAELRDRALRVLGPGAATDEEVAGRCETAIRLAVSHIVAPAPTGLPTPRAPTVLPPPRSFQTHR
jgi:AcrR family transcriptional regulator